MGKGSEQTLLQRGHIDGQQTYKKMFNVTKLIMSEKCKLKLQ